MSDLPPLPILGTVVLVVLLMEYFATPWWLLQRGLETAVMPEAIKIAKKKTTMMTPKMVRVAPEIQEMTILFPRFSFAAAA